MQFALALLAAVSAVTATSSADLISQLPSCAVSCIRQAETSAGCASGDYSCSCSKISAIQAPAASCLLSSGSCETSVITGLVSQVEAICAAISSEAAGGSSTAASSEAASTSVAASTTAAGSAAASGTTAVAGVATSGADATAASSSGAAAPSGVAVATGGAAGSSTGSASSSSVSTVAESSAGRLTLGAGAAVAAAAYFL